MAFTLMKLGGECSCSSNLLWIKPEKTLSIEIFSSQGYISLFTFSVISAEGDRVNDIQTFSPPEQQFISSSCC